MIKKYILVFLLLMSGLSDAFGNKLNESVLPLKFNTGNAAPYGLPSTVISIQGKKLPIIFDTGDSKAEIHLSAYALKSVRVHFTGKHVCSMAFNGKHCEKEFIIPKLKIGNFILRNIKGLLMKKLWGGDNMYRHFAPNEASKNGVIGYELLSQFNVLLDYAHSQAILVSKNNNPSDFKINQWVSVPFHGKLHTQLRLNNKLMTFGWGTGAVPSVIKQSSVRAFEKTTCPAYTKSKKENCLRTHSLETEANGHLPNTWFKVINIPAFAPFDGLIGSNFYRHNLVYFDFNNHRIYIKPN